MSARTVSVLVAVVGCLASACATVPQNRRAHLADPMMNLSDEPLDGARHQKLYDTREGAAGGERAFQHGPGTGARRPGDDLRHQAAL